MDAVFRVGVTPSGDDVVRQIRIDSSNMGRMERRLHGSRTRRAADDLVRRMIFLESGSQELRRDHFQVVIDGEDGSFRMEMLLRGHFVASKSDAETGVLDALKAIDNGRFGVDGPDRRRIIKLGADQSFV